MPENPMDPRENEIDLPKTTSGLVYLVGWLQGEIIQFGAISKGRWDEGVATAKEFETIAAAVDAIKGKGEDR